MVRLTGAEREATGRSGQRGAAGQQRHLGLAGDAGDLATRVLGGLLDRLQHCLRFARRSAFARELSLCAPPACDLLAGAFWLSSGALWSLSPDEIGFALLVDLLCDEFALRFFAAAFVSAMGLSSSWWVPSRPIKCPDPVDPKRADSGNRPPPGRSTRERRAADCRSLSLASLLPECGGGSSRRAYAAFAVL